MLLRWRKYSWAGFPCVDLSSVNSLGRGLQGKQSSLFYDLWDTTRPGRVQARACYSKICGGKCGVYAKARTSKYFGAAGLQTCIVIHALAQYAD